MIKAGDIVYLKSGGPSMTVGKVSFGKIAHVSFWVSFKNGDGYLEQRQIPVAALTTEVD